jgi:AcrR family transcriptional regulator
MVKQSPRVQRRRQETKERIVRAALELFLEKGIDGTTVAEIAEAANIGKGTFFTYFPTKDAVVMGIGNMLLDRMMAEQETEAPTRSEAIRNFLRPACQWHEEHPRLSEFVLAVYSQNPALPQGDSSLEPFYAHLVSIIDRGQQSGEFASELNPMDAATALFGSYFMSLFLWHLLGRQGSLVEMVDGAARLILRGLRP